MVSQVCDPAVDIINRDNIGPDELGFQAPNDPRYIEKDLQAMKVAGNELAGYLRRHFTNDLLSTLVGWLGVLC
ncbi:hypothetical protein A7C99_4614 [Trichophyton rubrum]|uniref:Uncharacterized protein n=1 Tax=Trichophyton rubrum TaxID=5551 RepID=A0A178EV37_TRIRU|nr:hypothetical protein A7C99_4614 [Trichophyton rubrum]